MATVLRDAGWSTFWVGKNHNIPVDEFDDGLVEEELAARAGLRPLLRVHRRRDQQLVSRPRRGQPLHRPAVPARRTATTCPRTSPTRRSSSSATRSSPSRTSRGTCGSAPAPTTPRTTRPQEYIDKYKGVFDDGYEAYREWVLPRMIERGILPEGTELTPINPMPDGTFGAGRRGAPVGLAVRRREARCSRRMAEVYAGFSEYTDAQVGRIVDYLEESGQLDNTIDLLLRRQRRLGRGQPERIGQREQVLQRLARRRSRRTSRCSTGSARPTPTTTTRRGGRSPSRRRTGCSSATRTRAACATRW